MNYETYLKQKDKFKIARKLQKQNDKSVKIGKINQERIVKRKQSQPSKGEQYIIDYLKSIGIRYTREHFVKTINNHGYFLFLDFYLRDYKVAIEFDGIQHFEPIYGEANLIKQKHNDLLKNNLCYEHGISLLRIPYYNIESIPKIIHEFLKGRVHRKTKKKF